MQFWVKYCCLAGLHKVPPYMYVLGIFHLRRDIHVHCILTPTLPQRFSGPAARGDFTLTVGSLLKKF